jgi:hypothetical protein
VTIAFIAEKYKAVMCGIATTLLPLTAKDHAHPVTGAWSRLAEK